MFSHILSLALPKGWSLRLLDINNAFLHAHLFEDVFIDSKTPGFIEKYPPTQCTHICSLKNTLYGLQQAPQAWYHELRQFLIATGFVNSKSGTSLFIYKQMRLAIYLLVECKRSYSHKQ